MITITKKFNFEMAHLLESHKGKCINLHGHSYQMHITVTSESLINGMVVDFGHLKKIINELLIDEIDHSFGYNVNSNDIVSNSIANNLIINNRKVYKFNCETTCEEMAIFMFDLLNQPLMNEGIKLLEIKLYEGNNSYATYRK